MPRRTKEQAEQTRQDILDAALEVFSTKGFVRTRLEDIAAKAGVTRGAIYFHFKDKVDIIMQLAESIDRSVQRAIPADVETRAESLEDIGFIITTYLELFTTDERFRKFFELVNYRTEWTEELDELVARDRKEIRRIMSTLEKDFTHLKNKGVVHEDVHPEDASLGLLALIMGLVEVWLTDSTLFDLMDRAPRIVWDYLEKLRKS